MSNTEYNPPSHVVTVAQVAEILDLKHQTGSDGKDEWHGPNPTGNGAGNDGFILFEDGNAWDRKDDTRYLSKEVAELASIAPNEYAPCVDFAARNGHASKPSNGTPKTKASKVTAKPNAKLRAHFDWKKATIFPYRDETGTLLFETGRCDAPDREKSMSQRRPDASKPSGYDIGKGCMDGVRRVLWLLRDVMEAQTVFIVEGEKCAMALNSALLEAGKHGDYVATTSPQGKGNWDKLSDIEALKDKRVIVLPDNDKDGHKYAADVCRSTVGIAQRVQVLTLPDLPAKGDIADFLSDGGTVETLFDLMESAPDWNPADATETDAPEFEFSTDSDLDSCLSEITWLWPGYIPNGFVSLIIGEQDTGKSTVAQDFCRTVICGGRWPDGTRCDLQADKLLWLDTEGSIALFRQRARAWKIPTGSFIFPRDPLQEIALDSDADLAWIEAAIEHFKPPLVVVDSLSGGHGGEENSNGEMKTVLKRLSAIAQRHNIAILAVHHLSKPAPGVPDYPVNLSRARGAGAITQFCRSVLALTAPDPHNLTARRLDVIKLNLARKPAPIGYELSDDGPAWGKAPEPPKPRRAADDAADWLRDAMAGGMKPSQEIEEKAAQQNISYNALCTAKKQLGIVAKREGGKDGKWFLILDSKPE